MVPSVFARPSAPRSASYASLMGSGAHPSSSFAAPSRRQSFVIMIAVLHLSALFTRPRQPRAVHNLAQDSAIRKERIAKHDLNVCYLQVTVHVGSIFPLLKYWELLPYPTPPELVHQGLSMSPTTAIDVRHRGGIPVWSVLWRVPSGSLDIGLQMYGLPIYDLRNDSGQESGVHHPIFAHQSLPASPF